MRTLTSKELAVFGTVTFVACVLTLIVLEVVASKEKKVPKMLADKDGNVSHSKIIGWSLLPTLPFIIVVIIDKHNSRKGFGKYPAALDPFRRV